MKAPFGSVRVHSLTFSYTPKSMRCDSRASLLVCNLVNVCLSREPKVRVTTKNKTRLCDLKIKTQDIRSITQDVHDKCEDEFLLY